MLKWVETNFVELNPGMSQIKLIAFRIPASRLLQSFVSFAHPANTLHLSFPKILRIQRGRLQGHIEFNHDKHTKYHNTKHRYLAP